MLKHTKKMWNRYRNPSPKSVEYNHLHKAWVIAELTVVSEKHRRKNATFWIFVLFCYSQTCSKNLENFSDDVTNSK